MSTRVPLSKRIRPNSEAAPWVVDEVKELEQESERDQRNAAKSQAESVKLLDRANQLSMKHLGCLTLLNACRRQIKDTDLLERIDSALDDAASAHPTMDIHQMKSGDWWIEPRK